MRIVPDLAAVSEDYDALFCDLWGCLHDGIRAFPEAVDALRAFRAKGGRVVLLTNAPRARREVARQIEGLGVPQDCWDTIATSGDSARMAMYQGAVGTRVWFVGEERDLTFFDPMHLLPDAPGIDRVPLAEAEGIVCTGPFDPSEDPDVMRPDFARAIDRGLKLLCANPDIVVDKGEQREWCAGALARLYAEMGGEALYFGKPHAPVYALARRRLAELDGEVPDGRILCVGDGIHTDIKGAADEGLASLFITGGLAREETATETDPEQEPLERFVAEAGIRPTYALGFLR